MTPDPTTPTPNDDAGAGQGETDPARAGLDADYAAAGFSGSLGWGEHPAVLVVDLCEAYLDRASPLYAGVEDAAASAERIVSAARGAGVPVVFTRVEYGPDQRDGVFYRKVPALSVFDSGSPLAGWPKDHPGLHPRDGELVITKQTASAFARTDLEERLRDLGIDTVVIVGVSTSGCVRHTATDAAMVDLVPLVVTDAVGDRHPDVHRSNLFDLGAKYADLVTEADVVAHLEGLRP